MTPRIAADLIRAGVAERARVARETLTGGTTMVLGPAWRHPTAWAVVGLIALLPTLSVIALSLLNTNRLADLFLVVSPPVAMLLAAAPLVRFGLTRVEGTSEASVSIRLRAVNVIVIAAGLAVSGLLVGHIVFESVMQVGP